MLLKNRSFTNFICDAFDTHFYNYIHTKKITKDIKKKIKTDS